MLTCQQCSNNLLLFSSDIHAAIESLEECINLPIVPPTFRQQYYIYKQQGVFDIMGNSTPGNSNNNQTFGPAPIVPQDINEFKALINTHNLSYENVKDRITKLSLVLTHLTNLTQIEQPICPKCYNDIINTKYLNYVDQLESNLELLLQFENDLLHIMESHKQQQERQQTVLSKDSTSTSNPNSSHKVVESTVGDDNNNNNIDPSKNEIEELLQCLQPEIKNMLLRVNNQYILLNQTEQEMIEQFQDLQEEYHNLVQREMLLNEYIGYMNTLVNNYLETYYDTNYAIKQYLTMVKSLKGRLYHNMTKLNQLTLTSPLYDIFAIDLTAPIPTISGLRLARDSDYQVDWYEINLALGQICLLLNILRKELFAAPRNNNAALSMDTNDGTHKSSDYLADSRAIWNEIENIQIFPLGHRSYISSHQRFVNDNILNTNSTTTSNLTGIGGDHATSSVIIRPNNNTTNNNNNNTNLNNNNIINPRDQQHKVYQLYRDSNQYFQTNNFHTGCQLLLAFIALLYKQVEHINIPLSQNHILSVAEQRMKEILSIENGEDKNNTNLNIPNPPTLTQHNHHVFINNFSYLQSLYASDICREGKDFISKPSSNTNNNNSNTSQQQQQMRGTSSSYSTSPIGGTNIVAPIISEDKINGFSIKYDPENEYVWANATRQVLLAIYQLMLIALK